MPCHDCHVHPMSGAQFSHFLRALPSPIPCSWYEMVALSKHVLDAHIFRRPEILANQIYLKLLFLRLNYLTMGQSSDTQLFKVHKR